MAATPNNNFNVLPWYNSRDKVNSKKWYAFGQTWPLICPNNAILPFQFCIKGIIQNVSTLTLVSIDCVNGVGDCMIENTAIQPVIITNEKAGYSCIMVHPGITSIGKTISSGRWQAQLTIGLDTFYSEVFTVVDNISDYVKLSYWNDENLYYNGGEINYSNSFKYTMYVCSTIGKPEYEFEEELTKRAGYKFLESQTSNKIYKFTFVAPEFICDAMRLIRLSDYIKIEYDGDSYNALSFSYEPKWETQGDLASVEVEFDTDAIIQKLVSFNRRQKEGFYNALLTNINEPLLFDVNTVALYYDEYRASVAAEIKDGKMIRDLSEISLVNENTLIVVDTGSGPAYKMSLYRLMEKFMRRDKDETTEHDFWVKGDTFFGQDASDNPTASISKDGIYRAVAGIIYDYLSSEKFVSGFTGEGFKIYKDEFGNWHIECDILDVRKVMNVFELIIQKVRSINGALVISQANGKVKAVTESPDLQSWILEFEDEYEVFQENDLVRCQVFDLSKVKEPAFDFTQFTQYLYDGTQIDDTVRITKTSVEFNLNNSANSGFQLYLRPAGHSEQTPITTKECILEVSGLYDGMMAIWNALDKEEQGIESIGGFLTNGENTIRAITEADGAYNLSIMVLADPGHGDGKVTITQKGTGGNMILPLKINAFKAYNSDTSALESADNYILTEDSIQVRRKSGYVGLYLSNELPLEEGMTSEKIVTMPSIKIKVENKIAYDTVQFIAIKKGGDVLHAIGIEENGIVALPEIKESDECTFYTFNVRYASLSSTAPGTGVKITIQKVEDITASKGKYYWCEVASVNGNLVTIPKSEFQGVIPQAGDDVVQMGNTKNPFRQSLIYMSAAEDGKPKIELLGGVKTKSLEGSSRSVFGNLDHITDPSFPDNMQPHGEGVYTDNGYFKGAFVFFNGKNAQTEIDKAQNDAANAQAVADAAKERLNIWASDGYISPAEKQQLLLEKKTITAEKSEINSQANRYNVNTASYNSAFDAYISQINQHTAAEPENIPVGPNLIPCQTDYYNNRTLILNSISAAVKAKTDYLETEMSAIPGKITLAIRSAKTSNVNMLRGAYAERANPSYRFGEYAYDAPAVNGKKYTLTLCYTIGDNINEIQAYSNNGYNFIARFTTKGNRVVESKEITMSGYTEGHGMSLYQQPNGTFGSKVHWAVLTDGDTGIANWIPAASEQSVGIKNLCSYKRMVDAGFTYPMDYTDDGHIAMDLGKLNAESYITEKDMFGLTYADEKRYLLLIDNIHYGYEINPNTNTLYIKILYKDGTAEGIQVVGTKPSKDYILTNKPIKCIVGTYYVANNPFARIGIYETFEKVAWTPAPEDVTYSYKKYTDTQILTVDGKIELSVKTKVENLGIGANNLYSYTSSPLNILYPSPTINRLINEHGFYLVGSQGSDSAMRIPNIIPGIAGKYTVSGWIKGSQNTPVGFDIDVCDSAKYTVRSTSDNNWSYFKHTFDVNKNAIDPATYNHVDIENIDWAYIWVKDFKVESGEIATAWSPNIQDGVYKSAEYTNQQISIVEGKITTTVEKITEVNGKVIGLASRVEQTEKSITSVVGDINTLNSTTNRHMTKQIDLTGLDNNKFFPLVIDLPVGHKSKIEINRPLNAAYGKPSYSTHDRGFSMNLSFEMSGSGWGSSTVVTNIFDYVRSWSSGKIVVDLGQITESSKCVMGVRGGSKYDVTVYDTTDRSTVNVYQTNYTGPYGQVFPVRTDGTEPVRTYGYYTEIQQLDHEISLRATKTEVTNSINGLNGRLEAAEIKLQPNNIALTVKEQGIGYGGTNYFGWGAGISKDIVGAGVYVTENRGTYGLMIACANTTATILLRYSQLGMNFKGPGKYTLSFKAKQQAGVAMDLNVNVCDAENFIITPPTTWQYYKKTFTVTRYTDSPYYGFIDFERSGGNTTQIIEFAEIMLEYGSEATQWRPAPFDTTAASGLLATGINISNGQIVLTADKTKFQNNSGTQIAVFDSNGINADLINAKKLSTAVAGKRIVVDPAAQEVQLYNENGNKVVAIGFKQDDRISIPYIQLKDYSYNGSQLRVFDIYGGTLYSNEQRYGANYGYTLSPTTGLQFTKNGSVTKSYPAQ